MKLKHRLTGILLGIITGIFCLSAVATPNLQSILPHAPGLSSKLLQLGYRAYIHGQSRGIDHQGIVTLIDYTKPSTAKRLWVINYKTNKVLFTTLVAQGQNSGLKYADKFSNRVTSHETSIGVYQTAHTYYGEHGLSLRLKGLDANFDNNAYKRDVVMHGASYVSPKFAHDHGYLGRSWGCFALDVHVYKPVINTIKNGTLLIAYYPDKKWLEKSTFLQPIKTSRQI